MKQPTRAALERRAKFSKMLELYYIETSGYYDHLENLKIRPEHLKDAKKLQREFNSLKGDI